MKITENADDLFVYDVEGRSFIVNYVNTENYLNIV